MVFHHRSGDTTGFPSILVKVRPELQVRRTNLEIFDHPKAAIKHLAWVNSRTIGNSPIVIPIVDMNAYPGRFQLVSGFSDIYQDPIKITNLTSSPDSGRILFDRFQTLHKVS